MNQYLIYLKSKHPKIFALMSCIMAIIILTIIVPVFGPRDTQKIDGLTASQVIEVTKDTPILNHIFLGKSETYTEVSSNELTFVLISCLIIFVCLVFAIREFFNRIWKQKSDKYLQKIGELEPININNKPRITDEEINEFIKTRKDDE